MDAGIGSASRLARLVLGTLLAAAIVAGYSAATAAAHGTHMHCGTPPGYCYWGYNYVSPGNTWVHGTWNYWFDQYVDKRNGGTIAHGFDPWANCYHTMTGTAAWYGQPSDLGCGGYLYPYVTYLSGNSSYLYFDDYA